MANVLEFVTPALATSLDISSYIESGTHLPLPPHTKVWAGNITAHGSKYITGKYELVPITLVLKIVGTSKSDLDDDIRALLVEITKKNILKWQPESATSAIYYTTYPYDTAEAHSILSKAHRDAFTVSDFTITLMADPFAWGAEQTIQVVENLCPNWNMETFTVPNVPDDWDVTETAGAGAAEVTEDTDAGDFIFGTSSVRLRATADDSVAAITTTDFITIDKTLHYCHFFNFQRESGSNRLYAYIDQYSAADALLESTAVNTVAATPNVWLSYTTPIYPDGEGGGLDEWNPNCAKVKLRFSVTGDTGGDDEVVNVDGIVFTCSEYLSDYLISNPLGIVIPASAISGDVPSPVDIYLSAFDDTVDSTNGIYVGGRDAYNSDFIPYAAADTGTAANSNIANQGDYRTIAIAGDKVINGGFENITGDPLLGNFDNWTETKHANGYIVASTSSKYGTYSACSWINDATTTRTNEIETTAYIAIDHLEAHTFSFWRKLLQYSGYGKIVVKLKEYTAVPALVATHTFTFNGHRPNWTHYSYTINGSGGAAPKFNVATTQVKIEFEMSGRKTGKWWATAYDTIYLDGVEFYQSSLPVALTAAFDLDSVEGFVQPFAHLKVGVAQSSVFCALEGNITDGANDITSTRIRPPPGRGVGM